MNKNRMLAALGSLVLVGTLLTAAPALAQTQAQSAAPSCQNAASSDIDANGYINIHPRVTCNGATVILNIFTSAPSVATQSVRYENSPAGTYSGYGISLPYTGPGDYCAVVDTNWTWAGSGAGTADTQSRHCFYRS